MTKQFAIVILIGASLFALWGGITLASQQGGGPAGLTGPVAVDLNVDSDICGHDQFIWGSLGPHNMTLQVAVNGSTIVISSSNSHWVTVTGDFSGPGNFTAAGTGTVAGHPNVTETLVGSWDGTTLSGAYTIGAANELPPCGDPPQPHPAIYSIKPKPTPTATVIATATPPKLYSIIVIKLNDDNLQPVPDWEIRLYGGPNCGGTALDTKQTDADGMVDFEGLDVGSYSVREMNETGWNPTGPTCKSVDLPGDVVAGIPACPIDPDAPFPQPGCDTFPSAARVQVRFNGTDTIVSADLGGPVQIRRNNKPTDKDGDGLDEVNTEMIFIDLTGPGITVRESALQHSNGLIEEQHNVTPGVLDFPANSYFDVFFEVDVGGMTLHNETPLRMACKIDAVPPYKCLYEPPITDPVELLNDDGVKIAKLVHGLHIPIPPNEVVVIFTNRPKTTPTVTATATLTPVAGTPTPTTTPTPNATATPTPHRRDGDANKDGTTNAIDAALVLQHDAGLIGDVNDSADVNGDGDKNSLDALLILQYVADLIDHLPI